MRYWLIAVLMLSIVRLLAACHRPVETVPQVEVVEVEWPPCLPWGVCVIGQVICSESNRPIIVIRPGIDSTQRPFTLLHEVVHQNQMKGDCKAVQKRYRSDPQFRYNMELEAYCLESEARIKAGYPAKEVAAKLSALMGFLFNIPEEEVWCDFMKPP